MLAEFPFGPDKERPLSKLINEKKFSYQDFIAYMKEHFHTNRGGTTWVFWSHDADNVLKIGPDTSNAFDLRIAKKEQQIYQEHGDLFIPILEQGTYTFGGERYNYQDREVCFQFQEKWQPVSHLGEDERISVYKEYFNMYHVSDKFGVRDKVDAVTNNDYIDQLRHIAEQYMTSVFQVKEALYPRNLGKKGDDVRSFDF